MYALFAPLGTTIVLMPLVDLQPNIMSKELFSGGLFPLNTTRVKLRHSRKAPASILVTELGMVILAKLLQPLKAPASILVTELGISTLVKLLQPLYLQPIITQYFIDNKSEIWLLFLIAHSKR